MQYGQRKLHRSVTEIRRSCSERPSRSRGRLIEHPHRVAPASRNRPGTGTSGGGLEYHRVTTPERDCTTTIPYVRHRNEPGYHAPRDRPSNVEQPETRLPPPVGDRAPRRAAMPGSIRPRSTRATTRGRRRPRRRPIAARRRRARHDHGRGAGRGRRAGHDLRGRDVRSRSAHHRVHRGTPPDDAGHQDSAWPSSDQRDSDRRVADRPVADRRDSDRPMRERRACAAAGQSARGRPGQGDARGSDREPRRDDRAARGRGDRPHRGDPRPRDHRGGRPAQARRRGRQRDPRLVQGRDGSRPPADRGPHRGTQGRAGRRDRAARRERRPAGRRGPDDRCRLRGGHGAVLHRAPRRDRSGTPGTRSPSRRPTRRTCAATGPAATDLMDEPEAGLQADAAAEAEAEASEGLDRYAVRAWPSAVLAAASRDAPVGRPTPTQMAPTRRASW